MENVFASLFLVVLGAGAVAVSFSNYGIGTAAAPQAGYFPMLLGLLLAALSGIVAVRDFIHRQSTEDGWPLRELFYIIGALVVFALLMGSGRSFGIPRTGLLPATFCLVLITSRAMREIGVKEGVLLALTLTCLSWAVFSALLGLAVPLWPWSY